MKGGSGLSQRAVAYVRVSDESQLAGYSLDAQRAQIAAYCERAGYELVHAYVDEGVSAHSDRLDKRPQLAAMLEAAARGEFEVVVVHSLDRLARNAHAQREAMQRLGRAGVGLHSITEAFDFTTPAGKLMLNMIGGVSEFFSDQLAVHVAKGQRERAAQGRPIGPVPFGYTVPEPGAVPLVDERAAPAVLDVFRRRAAGASLGDLASWLNGEGHRTQRGRLFTGHALKDLLNCRFYAGYVSYRTEEFPGVHEAIVPVPLFERVQARRQHRDGGQRPRDEGVWALRGLLFCAACGRPVHCERHADGVPYYRERHGWECTTVGRAVSSRRIDAEVGEWFSRVRLDRRWRERVVAAAVKGDGQKTIDALRDQRRRLARAYADGGYSEAEYTTRMKQLETAIEASQPDRVPQLETIAALVADTRRLWSKALPHERRQLLAPLIDRVTVCLDSKRVVEIVPSRLFAQLISPAARIRPPLSHL